MELFELLLMAGIILMKKESPHRDISWVSFWRSFLPILYWFTYMKQKFTFYKLFISVYLFWWRPILIVSIIIIIMKKKLISEFWVITIDLIKNQEKLTPIKGCRQQKKSEYLNKFKLNIGICMQYYRWSRLVLTTLSINQRY